MNLSPVRGLCACLLLCAIQSAWSMPNSMSVSGRLLDANGNPIHYYKTFPTGHVVDWPTTLTTQMKFYESETTSTCIYTLNTTCLASQGYFNLTFKLPWSILQKEPLYYSLAIDADRNGLTSNDLFAGRFTWGTVPWALSAKPLHSFTTHYAETGSLTEATSRNGWFEVAVFEAPAGGIEFNRMMVNVYNASSGYSFSFGIYDLQGNVVAYSGKITPQIAIGGFLEIKLPQTVKLEPSTCYYTACTRSNQAKVYIHGGLSPAHPMFGFIPNTGGDGSLPATIDLDKLDYNKQACAIPIVLSLVETSPAKAATGVRAPKNTPWISMKDVQIENTMTSAKYR